MFRGIPAIQQRILVWAPSGAGRSEGSGSNCGRLAVIDERDRFKFDSRARRLTAYILYFPCVELGLC